MQSVWFATHPISTSPTGDFVAGAHADTVIAGAGLTGLATGVLLARSGQRVVIVEGRRVGAVTTGNTTAKLSLLQGVTLSQIARFHSKDVVRAYVEGNLEGQALLVHLMTERGVPFQRRDAYSYASTRSGADDLRAELEVANEAGLPVEWTDQTELPFAVAGAIRLADQVQIHPLAVLDLLLAEFARRGGVLFEETRVTDVDSGSPVTITTSRGEMTADRLVLATGSPILDRGGYFAKLVPQRSYATAYRVPGAPDSLPKGMYLSVDEPTRSLRTLPVDGDELLLVGGNGHVTGRSDSPAAALADLADWTGRHFAGAQLTHSWSAQDYQSINRVPFVGTLPRGGGKIYVATGYAKWGMTNAVAAALHLSGVILEGQMPWADQLEHRITKPAGVVSALAPNVEVAVELAKDWVQAELGALPGEPPAEGECFVGRGPGGKPEAVSTVDGQTCRLSAVCTHMGGIVRWNDAEKSWDCPLHGSRFAADGTRLEGPAVHDLARRD